MEREAQLVKEDIETVIDRLLDYVHRAGKASLGDAASAVGRPASQVEKLALLLEEKGLLEVHYDITGVKIAAPKQEEPGGQGAGNKRKPDSPDAPTGVLDESRELEREVLTSESLMKFFEKDLERRVIRAEKMLELLEKSDYTKHELEEATKEIELAIKQLEAFEKEVAALASKGEEFRQRLAGFRQKLSKIKPIEPARQPPSAPLKNQLAKIIAEITAFLEFVKTDLKRMLQKPAKQPLPKITQAKQAKESKRQEYPPIAVPVERPLRLEKAHKVRLIRSGTPVITTTAQEKELISTPFVQKGAQGTGKQRRATGQKSPETSTQLSRAVVSLEKIAQTMVGKKSGMPKTVARGSLARKKTGRNAKRARRHARKATAKTASKFASKDKARGKLHYGKVRLLEVRKDGNKQHYWVNARKKQRFGERQRRRKK